MKFKAGDRIRFLNTSGGGIITKVLAPDMVSVAIEDGFEIPTLISEIIKVEVDNAGIDLNAAIFPGNVKRAAPVVQNDDDNDSGYERISELGRLPGRQDRAAGIYLVFHPRDQQWLLTGRLDIYLINHTSYDILYSLFLREDDSNLRGVDYDGIPPYSKLHLKTIRREETASWTDGILQVLFHKDRPGNVLLPVNSRFRVKETKFLKESSYIETSFLQGKSVMMVIAELAHTGLAEKVQEKSPEQVPLTAASIEEKPDFLEKHRAGARLAEVDLHIDMITDEGNKMNDGEKLKFQLSYAKQSIDEAIERNYEKLILVHGVGNGTLRRELHVLLSDFEGIDVYDASYKKYGTGAIEIRFRRQ